MAFVDRSATLAKRLLLICAALAGARPVFSDVCLTATNIDNYKRSVTYRSVPEDIPICDAFIDSGWYRFGDNQLMESCVVVEKCNTFAPIWMNGAHPTAANPGPALRRVCSQHTYNGDCCQWGSEIMVRWCQNATTGKPYFVYMLEPPPVCDSGYCVADAAKPPSACPINCAWNDVIKRCSCPEYPKMSGAPILSSPYISARKPVIDKRGIPFDATKFSFSCTVGYEKKTDDDGARFEVLFMADGIFVAKFIVKSTNPMVELDEMYLWKNGGKRPENDKVMLGRSLVCRASPYWESKSPSYGNPLFSKPYWIGIRPINDLGVFLPKVIVKTGQTFHFRMESTVPVTTGWCFLTDRPCDPDYYRFRIIADNRVAVIDRQGCFFRLNATKISEPIVSSVVPSINPLQPPFIWQIPFVDYTELLPSPGGISLFQQYKIDNVIVEVIQPSPRPRCSATGDPHITTFRGKLFHLYQLGDFYLVKEPQRWFEVQVRLFTCNGVATCICGVLVREGNNVLGADVCKNSAGNIPRLTRILTDEKNPSGIIVATGNGWTITLSSGIEITIDNRGNSYLDVTVIGLNVDNYNGLCSLVTVQYPCGSDCSNWRVPPKDSLFNTNTANKPQCTPSIPIPSCKCDGRVNNSPTITCEAKPVGLPLLNTGFSCNLGGRAKRSITTLGNDVLIDPDILYNKELAIPDETFGYSVETHWPTRSGITEDKAKQRCNSALRDSTIYSICSGLDNSDFTHMITNCVADIQLMDSFTVVDGLPAQLQRYCVYAIESSIVESSNGSNETDDSSTNDQLKQQLNDVKSQICPGQCNQRGDCMNATCVCHSGYSGEDCSIARGEPPSIQEILNPRCDIRVQNDICNRVLVSATNVLTKMLTCRMRDSGSSSILYDYDPTVSGSVVACSLPSTLTKSSIYHISLSNDEATYGKEIQYTLIADDAPIGILTVPTSTSTTTSPSTARVITSKRRPTLRPRPTNLRRAHKAENKYYYW